jgi:hypothetical protein
MKQRELLKRAQQAFERAKGVGLPIRVSKSDAPPFGLFPASTKPPFVRFWA